MTNRISSVLVVDPVGGSCEAVMAELGPLVQTVWRAKGIQTAQSILRDQAPAAIVSEVKLEDGSVVDLLNRLRTEDVAIPVVVLTSRGSIALAVRSLRCGAVDFLTKPATGEEILSRLNAARGGSLEAVDSTLDDLLDVKNFTLHRAMWEYINRVMDEAGSIHGAARRLGLERRSLQRMLAKHPPPEHARDHQTLRTKTGVVAVGSTLSRQPRLRKLG